HADAEKSRRADPAAAPAEQVVEHSHGVLCLRGRARFRQLPGRDFSEFATIEPVVSAASDGAPRCRPRGRRIIGHSAILATINQHSPPPLADLIGMLTVARGGMLPPPGFRAPAAPPR